MKDKHFGVVALCLLCLLLAALPVAAQEDGYSFIRKDSTGSTWSLHLPSVEVRWDGRDSYVVGWIRVVWSDARATEIAKAMGAKPHHCMAFFAANTSVRQIQLISETHYDKEGRQIYNHSPHGGSFRSYAWEEFTPGSNKEAVWQALMKAAGYIR